METVPPSTRRGAFGNRFPTLSPSPVRMALRTRAPVPVPAAELRALLDRLPNAYASSLWYGGGQAVLVARVPRTEPDLIEDVERVVEHAHPDHVHEADQCLLVGTERIHGVPMTPLKSLMADRVAFDRRQCSTLRTQLADTRIHTLYRAPDDPQRRLRLALRVPGEHVTDVDEDDLDLFVDRLGPLLDVGELDGLHCVYVIANRDDVRLEADAFLADLLEKWRDPDRQERLAEARRTKREERDRHQQGARQEGTAGQAPQQAPPSGSGTDDPSTAAPPGPEAPVPATASDDPPEPTGRRDAAPDGRPVAEAEHRLTARTEEDFRSIQHQVDALEAEGWDASPLDASSSDRRTVPVTLPHEDTDSPGLDRLRAVLERHGFDVLVRPEVPDHDVDLAAERPDGDPQRIIVVERDRIDGDDARALVAAGRALDADRVLALCDEVTSEAERRLVATMVRTVAPADLGDLRL